MFTSILLLPRRHFHLWHPHITRSDDDDDDDDDINDDDNDDDDDVIVQPLKDAINADCNNCHRLIRALWIAGVYVIIVKRLLVSGQAADGEKAGKGDGWVESEHGQECCFEDATRAAHHHETQNSSSKEPHHQLSPPSTRI